MSKPFFSLDLTQNMISFLDVVSLHKAARTSCTFRKAAKAVNVGDGLVLQLREELAIPEEFFCESFNVAMLEPVDPFTSESIPFVKPMQSHITGLYATNLDEFSYSFFSSNNLQNIVTVIIHLKEADANRINLWPPIHISPFRVLILKGVFDLHIWDTIQYNHVEMIDSFIVDGRFSLPPRTRLPCLTQIYLEIGEFDDEYDFENINEYTKLDTLEIGFAQSVIFPEFILPPTLEHIRFLRFQNLTSNHLSSILKTKICDIIARCENLCLISADEECQLNLEEFCKTCEFDEFEDHRLEYRFNC